MSLQYSVEVRHDGLHKYRLIRGTNRYVVEQKAQAQLAQWDEQWARRCELDQRRREREQQARDKVANLAEAECQTREAEAAVAVLSGILEHTLSVDDRVCWDSLKDTAPFLPEEPRLQGRAPRRDDPVFHVSRTFWSFIISSVHAKRVRDAAVRYKKQAAAWQAEELRIAALHEQWTRERDAYLARQAECAAKIDAQRDRYLAGDPDAIADYCELVLTRSSYPDEFPQEFELDYLSGSRTVVVDYGLPPPNLMPRIKSVRYVQSRSDFVESELSDKVRRDLFNSTMYQIALRTVHELFEADAVGGLDAVVFNGWVRTLDPAVGKETNSCILSLQTTKEEFLAINLAQIDPKSCFKRLKGVAAAQLASITPVAPLMQVSREDDRFIDARAVLGEVREGTNLAAVDWEDFEHLVREIFECEFATGGGEVRVTQASRDGGVDAIAFDPDPIRGGKIVIQAKRYTNTVGVAAVRDLYGTVVNEGAIKGILVTTSDYGPDAHEFARDKPISLLSGANLLHLLDRHGRKAYIDLAEAREARRANETR